jgi:hypothetical protein
VDLCRILALSPDRRRSEGFVRGPLTTTMVSLVQARAVGAIRARCPRIVRYACVSAAPPSSAAVASPAAGWVTGETAALPHAVAQQPRAPGLVLWQY